MHMRYNFILISEYKPRVLDSLSSRNLGYIMVIGILFSIVITVQLEIY